MWREITLGIPCCSELQVFVLLIIEILGDSPDCMPLVFLHHF